MVLALGHSLTLFLLTSPAPHLLCRYRLGEDMPGPQEPGRGPTHTLWDPSQPSESLILKMSLTEKLPASFH